MLIPARNEADNIAPRLALVLQSEDVDLEVIVLDDDSTDRTAEIVREIAETDPRVRLETAAILARWAGAARILPVINWLSLRVIRS